MFFNDANILFFNEPNKDLLASFFDALNLTVSVLLFLSSIPTGVFSSFKSSKVKNSENAVVIKFF